MAWLLLGMISLSREGLAPTVGRLGGGRRACVDIVGSEVRRGRTANSVGGGMMLLA